MTPPGARSRLHPLSPVLHSAKTLAVLLAALSVQGAVRLGLAGLVGTLVVVAVIATGVSAISWLVTGYQIVGRELRIHDGVLVRRARAIPLDRLQAVEVVRPLLARLFGLAELRLEVVGRGETEAPLAYLSHEHAVALREQLLAIAAGAGAPAGLAAGAATGAAGTATAPLGPAPAPTGGAAGVPVPGAAEAPDGAPAAPLSGPRVPADEQPLHTVSNRDVLISQIRTPPVLVLPLAVAGVVAQYWFDDAWSLVVLASMLVAVIGVVRQPVRRILANWHFRLAWQPPGPDGPGALRIYHGASEIRSQTVPLHRIQAVEITWPLLWRSRRWLRIRIDVAGYAETGEEIGASDHLLPVGDLETARRLLPVVLPGVDPTTLPLVGVPRRARWLAPLTQPVLGIAVTDRVVAVRTGRLTPRLVLVPYARVQSVRLVQDPFDRWLGLADVHLDTAGSNSVAARHRDLAEARELAASLVDRVHAALAAARTTRTGVGTVAGALVGGDAPTGGDTRLSLAGRDEAGAAGDPPPLGPPDRHHDHDHVRPAGQHVDDPVLPGVDQGEGHGQRIGGEQRPPAAPHRAGEVHHDEQGERGVQ